MDTIEKKLNQILNLLNLVHSENMFVLSLITSCIVSDKDKIALQEYIEECQKQKMTIISGMYEDEIKIVD